MIESDLTTEQAASARRTCKRFSVPYKPEDWEPVPFGDGAIGRFFPGPGGIFIGIEQDGYAHS